MVVSVIIPLYNGEKFIRKTIQSILNQTYKDVEIIIVDDCSTDNSKEVIFNEFGGLIGKKIIYVRNQENMERSYTRNRGFEANICHMKQKILFVLQRYLFFVFLLNLHGGKEEFSHIFTASVGMFPYPNLVVINHLYL